MRSKRWGIAAAVLIVAAEWVGMPGGASAAAGTAAAWGPAQPVPISPSVGLYASVTALSCPAPGNCVAAGDYYDGGLQGFVMQQENGVWGEAQPIPGLAAVNTGRQVTVYSISCASPGNCAAGGSYYATAGASSSSHVLRGFVVSEVNGTWSTVDALPPPVASTFLGRAQIHSVSCTAPGDCLAGGYDSTDYTTTMAFVVEETNGIWGAPAQVPGAAAYDEVNSVSCAAPGDCVAGLGEFRTGYTAALATESSGTWAAAQPVPGLAGLVSDQQGATIYSVSCPSAGNCTAAGEIAVPYEDKLLFVVDETNGTWGNASELGGSTASGVNSIDFDQVPLSCASPGNCALAGTAGGSGFIADEVNGTWSSAAAWAYPVLKSATGRVTALSCTSAGNCSAGGVVSAGNILYPFLIDETNGTWAGATGVSGAPAGIEIDAVSCASAASCVAASSDIVLGFLVERAPVTPTITAISLPAGPVSYGHEQAERVSVSVSAASGVPTGTVAVKSGAVTVCTATLSGGRGSCAVPAKRFGPGVVKLDAVYAGPAWFARSASAEKSFTVTRASTSTALRLSAPRVRYGHEQAEKISVSVTPAYAGPVAGTVIVKAGTATVCAITLKAGRGSCALTARKLRIGTYRLLADYGGNADYTGSASGKVTLTVTR